MDNIDFFELLVSIFQVINFMLWPYNPPFFVLIAENR